MGKIFDALEKSRREQHAEDRYAKMPRDVGKVQTDDGKMPEALIPEPKQVNPEPPKPVSSAAGNVPMAETDDISVRGKSPSSHGKESPETEEGTAPHGIPETPGDRNFHPNTVDPNFVTLTDPTSYVAEQFKMLKTNLLFPVSGQPPKSIMVTSALPGEGKSFVAANLAISLAQNINEHVILLDCDLRKPSIHQCLGYGNVPGLSEYLSSDIQLSSLLLKATVDKLTLLPGGTPPHNPAELLSSDKMKTFLDEVKTRYEDRYVIIDSPPPNIIPESSAIARRVDGVLLVVKYGHTPRRLVEEVIELIGKEKIIGVIMNWTEPNKSRKLGYSEYYGVGDKESSLKK